MVDRARACRRSRSAGSRRSSTPTVAYASSSPPFILAGIGMALFFAPVANVVLSAVRPEEEGKALGRQQRDPRARRRARRRGARERLRGAGGYASRPGFVDGLVPAVIGRCRRARRRRAARAGRCRAARRARPRRRRWRARRSSWCEAVGTGAAVPRRRRRSPRRNARGRGGATHPVSEQLIPGSDSDSDRTLNERSRPCSVTPHRSRADQGRRPAVDAIPKRARHVWVAPQAPASMSRCWLPKRAWHVWLPGGFVRQPPGGLATPRAPATPAARRRPCARSRDGMRAASRARRARGCERRGARRRGLLPRAGSSPAGPALHVRAPVDPVHGQLAARGTAAATALHEPAPRRGAMRSRSAAASSTASSPSSGAAARAGQRPCSARTGQAALQHALGQVRVVLGHQGQLLHGVPQQDRRVGLAAAARRWTRATSGRTSTRRCR